MSLEDSVQLLLVNFNIIAKQERVADVVVFEQVAHLILVLGNGFILTFLYFND